MGLGTRGSPAVSGMQLMTSLSIGLLPRADESFSPTTTADPEVSNHVLQESAIFQICCLVWKLLDALILIAVILMDSPSQVSPWIHKSLNSEFNNCTPLPVVKGDNFQRGSHIGMLQQNQQTTLYYLKVLTNLFWFKTLWEYLTKWTLIQINF